MTGFTETRAAPHEAALRELHRLMWERGEPVEELPLDGHRPDLRILRNGELVDVKTSNTERLAVELDSFNCYRRIEIVERTRVYIVHWHPSGWFVDTPDSLAARISSTSQIASGPNRRRGTGSHDDWYLIGPGGTPLDQFFPT